MSPAAAAQRSPARLPCRPATHQSTAATGVPFVDPALCPWCRPTSDDDSTTAGTNGIDRTATLAVLGRRRNFGCNSAAGCRFVERILTVVQTCRVNGRSPLTYLTQALHAHWHHLPAPSLLAQG